MISTKDAYRGESVKAVVVLRATHKDTTAQQIIDWCRENMAVYKIPRGAVRRRAAQERQRQGDVAVAAGSGKQDLIRI